MNLLTVWSADPAIGAAIMTIELSARAGAGARPSTWAYVSGVLFLGLAVAFGATQGNDGDMAIRTVAVLGIAFHLALLPVVLMAPAPFWATIAGLAWLAIDITSNSMALAGASESAATTVRLVGHLPAGVWIIAVSWSLTGIARWTGTALGVWLAGYTLVAGVVPEAAFMPAMLLMLAWLPILGRALGQVGR